MKHNSHSQRNIKTNRNMRFSGSKPAAENVIVFSPTACPSSEKKQCAPEELCGQKSDAPAAKKDAAAADFFLYRSKSWRTWTWIDSLTVAVRGFYFDRTDRASDYGTVSAEKKWSR